MNLDAQKKLKNLAPFLKGTLFENFEIECIELQNDFLILKMPLSPKISRPGSLLHGGAMVALAESAGSLLSFICLDFPKNPPLTIEISCNHLATKKINSQEKEFLFAKARFLHKGRTTHLIQVAIYDENQQKISLCKMTNLILDKKN